MKHPAYRLLAIDPRLCNGCMHCQDACAQAKTGTSDRAHSRIHIFDLGHETFLPVACQQCEEAPCVKACPKEALSKDETTGLVSCDYERCVACRMCVFACPFGAMAFDEARGLTFKCDLCQNEPACVPVCEPKAIVLAEPETNQCDRRRAAAAVYGPKRS